MGGVTDIAVFVLFLESLELLGSLVQLVLLTVYASLVPHRIDHGITNLRYGLAAAFRTVRDFFEFIFPFLAILSKFVLAASVIMLFCVSGCTVTGRMTKDEYLRQGVCPQTVGTMYGYTAALTGNIDARYTRLTRMEVSHLKAAHGIMAGRCNRNWLFRDVDTSKAFGKVSNLTQTLADTLSRNNRKIHVDAGMDAFANTTALLDLRCNSTRYNITRCQLHLLRCIFRHKTLAILVLELCTLGTAGLGQQDAVSRKARRMELYHLRIFERDTRIHASNDTIARGAVRIRRTDPIDTAIAARRNDNSLSRNADEIPRTHIHSDNAVELVILLTAHADLKHLALRDEINALVQALFE